MKKLYPILGMATTLAILASSCVTNEYDLNNINTEVTIGSDVIELPIGHIDTLTVDSILNSFLGDIEYVKTESNGDLKIAFDTAINYTMPAFELGALSADDILPAIDPITVALSGSNNSFPTDGFQLPQNSFEYTISIPSYTIIDETTKLPAMSFKKQASEFGSLVNGLPVIDGISVPINISGNEDLTSKFNCPEQIQKIKKVWFAGQGAQVFVNFDLGGLTSVATEPTINSLVITLPENYELTLTDNLNGCASLNANGNQLTITNYKTDASGKLAFTAYLKGVDLSDIEPVNGVYLINDKLTYELDFGFTTKAGTISLTPTPALQLTINNAEFGDAEVVSAPITIDAIESSTPLNYTLDGLSPDLDRVLHIDFAEGSDIVIKLDLEKGVTIPFKGWNECPITIGLPECFRLDESKLANATLDQSKNTLSTTISAISKGLRLPLRKLDFGEGLKINVTSTDNGNVGRLSLNEELFVKIAPEFPSDTYLLSEITKAMGDKKIKVSLAESHLIIVPETSEIVINELSKPINFESDIKTSVADIPEQLKKIDYVSVVDEQDNEVLLNLAFELSECPIDNIILRDFKIELPKCLWIEGEGIDSNNVLSINKTIDMTQSNVIEIADIKLKGIKNLDVVDGSLIIDDKIKIQGAVAIPEGEVLHGVSNDITITPLFEIPTMQATEFVGRVNIDVSSFMEPQAIDLSKLTKQLQESEVDVDLTLVPPVICIDVANPIGVEIDGTLQLTAYYPDETTLPLSIPLHLNGAEGEQRGISKICITNQLATAPEGYTAVTPDNYDKLFSKIPNKLEYAIEGCVDENTVCTLALGDDYNFDLNVALDLPVALLNTNIQKKGVFGDLSGTFEQIVGYNLKVGEIGIVINATSTLPIELSAELKAIDKDGQQVEGIVLTVDGSIGGCGKNGAPKTSTLAVLVSGNMDNLQYIDAIAYTLSGATTGEEFAYININQYMMATAYARIEEGVTFDLKTLLEKLGEESNE